MNKPWTLWAAAGVLTLLAAAAPRAGQMDAQMKAALELLTAKFHAILRA